MSCRMAWRVPAREGLEIGLISLQALEIARVFFRHTAVYQRATAIPKGHTAMRGSNCAPYRRQGTTGTGGASGVKETRLRRRDGAEW